MRNLYLLSQWLLVAAVMASVYASIVHIDEGQAVSESCLGALLSYSSNYDITNGGNCSRLMLKMLSTTSNLQQCLAGGPGSGVHQIDCSDYGSVIYGGVVDGADIQFQPYYIPTEASSCIMCAANPNMKCNALLAAVSSIAGGVDGSDDIAITGSESVKSQCSNYEDSRLIIGARYQSELLCQSVDTFGHELTKVNTLNGVLDMRSMLQCGKCSMIPCLPGQYCGANSAAIMCPAGSYCPMPHLKFDCPSGYYCPLGSTSAIKCRSIAFGSCTGGAIREVVWVPLFLALLLLVFVAVVYWHPPGPILTILGMAQSLKSADMSSKSGKVVYSEVNTSEISKRAGVRIEFTDIVMKSGDNVRLDNVSGCIKPGRFTAIMGSSGAGKTTLMNVLLSREYKTSGTISFVPEGKASALKPYQIERLVAFVPQTDVLLCEMTVYQLLKHSALMRLPANVSMETIETKIDSILETLDISHIRHTIAKASEAGVDRLSPGDKKKVSIAIELIADPSVCFLDEPTTGIDASSAMSVAKIIKNMAAAGVTVVAVIHQPRAEIFNLIDNVIILVPGGRKAYDGPAKDALKWFASYGCYIYTPKNNKADFLLDITSGKYNPALLKNHPSDFNEQLCLDAAQLTSKNWAELWLEKGKDFIDLLDGITEEIVGNTDKTIEQPVSFDVIRRGFAEQYKLSLTRSIIQRFKAKGLLVAIVISLIGGAIIGIVTSGGPLSLPTLPPTYKGSCPPGAAFSCNGWLRFEIGPATFLITMLVGAIMFPLSITTFGREKEYLAREAAVGCNKTAYFLGKVSADILVSMTTVTFLFVSALVSIAPWTAPFEQLLLVVFSTSFSISTIGYFLSLIMKDPDNAVLVGVILAILLNLFGGFVPLLGDGPIGYIFFTHFSARAISTVELQNGMGMDDAMYNAVVNDPWKHPNWRIDVLVLWIMGFIWTAFSYALLLRNNPRRYK